MSADPTFTTREKMLAARKEVTFREWVYKRRVADGKMTQEQADRGIAIMRAIEQDYVAALAAEDQAGRLPL